MILLGKNDLDVKLGLIFRYFKQLFYRILKFQIYC